MRSRAHADLDSDAALIELVRMRDADAMTKVFDRYASLAYSVAFRVLKDATAAEDVMQELLIRLWENPNAFVAQRGSLAAWLAVSARNRAVDLLRRRKPTDPIEDVILPSPVDLVREAERNIIMERIRGHFESLPADQRQSLEFAYFEGLTHAEIAVRTGAPLGTVKTRIRSALHSLRQAVHL